MKGRDTGLAVLFVVCLVCTTAGCRSGGGGTEADGPRVLKVAFVTNNSADFWTIARRGVEKADAELADVETEFRLTADGTAAEQQRIVDDLLTKGVDAIAISPVDPENQASLIDAAAQRTVVFTQDSDAPQTARTCYIGTDNLAAGRQAGQLIRDALPEGGSIMLFVGKLDARNAQERIQGIREALAGSNIRVLDVRTDDADDVRAKANAADTLVRYPDIKGLVGLWSYNGPAILNAVREAGKIGQVQIIAFDEADETLSGVREGAIHATVVQQPYEFGYQAIVRMAQAVRGDRSFIPESKQIIVPTLVVSRSNVEEFTKRIDELRGRWRSRSQASWNRFFADAFSRALAGRVRCSPPRGGWTSSATRRSPAGPRGRSSSRRRRARISTGGSWAPFSSIWAGPSTRASMSPGRAWPTAAGSAPTWRGR
jgi:ribose transport system substrate-binding protein